MGKKNKRQPSNSPNQGALFKAGSSAPVRGGSASQPFTLQGILEGITFQNSETGFTVARFTESGKRDVTVTVVGTLAGVPVGSSLKITGHWVRDARHGLQFKILQYVLLKPNTVHGIERYLGSGLIKGIGPKFAARIVDRFGVDTLDILDKNPQRLLEVEGLGKKRFAQIRKAWHAQQQIHQIMVFLQGHGISAVYAVKIFKTYGVQSIDVVKQNPYRLAEDVWGIGFKTADAIAGSVGIAADDPRRARAGLLFVLGEGVGDGHCFLPVSELFEKGKKLLGLAPELLDQQIPQLVSDEKIAVDKDSIYLTRLFYAEKGAAQNLMAISAGGAPPALFDTDRAIASARQRMNITFADEQIKAISTALQNKVTIVTGGPGTGKSTILKALILILEKQGLVVKLAAPTGRAAKRLSEATGRQAKTIHRMLEFDPSVMGFKHNDENPLKVDFVVVDEISMMDVSLAHALFKAVPNTASLLLVGDADQLPSVGPGNVLRDIIDSGRIPVVRLTQIFRQSPGSLISLNAARINAGEPVELLPHYKGEKDFYFIPCETPEQVEQQVLSLCAGRLTKKYGFDPLRDIQVLTPMRKGIIGAGNLNRRLQETLNPGRPGLDSGGWRFCVGDKVMQIRNNYEKEVFNGDLAYVVDCDRENETLLLRFDEKTISYELSELNELELAYAVTVHKSQGSEFPCIVLPLHTTHYPLLQRNLIYTGITRGKRLVVVVGSKKALAVAISNNKVAHRYTRLNERLAAW